MSPTATPPTQSRTTKIEWTHHTLNFWWGCTKVSPACRHCYAEKFAAYTSTRLFGRQVTWGKGAPRAERLQAARAEALKLNAKAGRDALRRVRLGGEAPPPQTRIFVNSMSDIFDDEVPVAWLAFALETMFLCPHLTFQLLTKRPENALDRIGKVFTTRIDTLGFETSKTDRFANWLDHWLFKNQPPLNIWGGITVENDEWWQKRRKHFLNIPFAVRFLSCEPLLGPLELGLDDRPVSEWACWTCNSTNIDPDLCDPTEGNWWKCHDCGATEYGEAKWQSAIHWVITGGESGPKALPTHPDHFRSLRDQCHAAGVPFLFKQWGEWIPTGDHAIDALNRQRHADPTFCSPKGYKDHRFEDLTQMLRLGKDKTGNHLDGRQHLEFPVVGTQASRAPAAASEDAAA